MPTQIHQAACAALAAWAMSLPGIQNELSFIPESEHKDFLPPYAGEYVLPMQLFLFVMQLKSD